MVHVGSYRQTVVPVRLAREDSLADSALRENGRRLRQVGIH
jgi:hypothetical protein